MNSNMALTCEVCEQDTDCRIGYSNRRIQPLSFSCPHCGSLLRITLDITNAPASDFRFKNCHPSENQPLRAFSGENPFVDLHLDFPVRFGHYVMGATPFMIAMQDLGGEDISPEEVHNKFVFHNRRLEQLNYFHDKSEEIKTILRLYSGRNKQLFKKRVGDFLKKDQGSSLKPEDLNASLYQFVSTVFLPFVDLDEVETLVDEFSKLTMRLHGAPLDNFIGNLMSSGFLNTLQKDCLKIYPEIYNAEMPIRPALFLDLTDAYKKAKIAGRVSTKDFQLYKDLYKDIIEVFARELILIAGINNIIHRGDSDSFKEIDGGRLSSLEKFASKTLSQKFKYLDECWYPLDQKIIDTGIRNAIAHNNVQYNEVTQEITYYPNGGGIKEPEGHTIYFLDFMRMILEIFREMHNLHHLIKSFFYYEFLIRNKI